MHDGTRCCWPGELLPDDLPPDDLLIEDGRHILAANDITLSPEQGIEKPRCYHWPLCNRPKVLSQVLALYRRVHAGFS